MPAAVPKESERCDHHRQAHVQEHPDTARLRDLFLAKLFLCKSLQIKKKKKEKENLRRRSPRGPMPLSALSALSAEAQQVDDAGQVGVEDFDPGFASASQHKHGKLP